MRADEKQTRTKEEAKKLADSIGALVKADPMKFNEYVQMSDEPGAQCVGSDTCSLSEKH
jgi:peptidyl-prolyl cis-trans isomerase D